MPQRMSKVFVDASVLFAAAYSKTGSARDLIVLGIAGKAVLIISQDVIDEVERNLKEDAPEKLEVFKTFVGVAFSSVVTDLSKEEVLEAARYTALKDAPIVAAARKAQASHLVTYDRKHLLNKPEVAKESGLVITTPDVVVKAILEAEDTADGDTE
jgi:predicted nucleic acid-binding protein